MCVCVKLASAMQSIKAFCNVGLWKTTDALPEINALQSLMEEM
jgi:hypothetical protein